jgi:hypothetical protein
MRRVSNQVLYTIMPLELIFAEEIDEPEEENVGGVTMIWRSSPEGQKYLSRIISTDLKDFLKYSV